MFAGIITWVLGRVAAWGLSGIVAQVAPIVIGIVKLGGAILSAIAEIIMALARSPEGRVVLGLLVGALAFLYVRFHYIQEGVAREQVQSAAKVQRALAAQKASLKCPVTQPKKRR